MKPLLFWASLASLALIQAAAGAFDVMQGRPPPNLLSLIVTGFLAGTAIGNLFWLGWSSRKRIAKAVEQPK